MPIDKEYVSRKGIKPGDVIEIVPEVGDTIFGFFQSVNDKALTFSHTGILGPISYAFNGIKDVYLLERKK